MSKASPAFHIGIIGGGGISQTHVRAASSIEGVGIAAVGSLRGSDAKWQEVSTNQYF